MKSQSTGHGTEALPVLSYSISADPPRRTVLSWSFAEDQAISVFSLPAKPLFSCRARMSSSILSGQGNDKGQFVLMEKAMSSLYEQRESSSQMLRCGFGVGLLPPSPNFFVLPPPLCLLILHQDLRLVYK